PQNTGFTPYDVDTNGFKYGVGAQYFFDGANGVRADWTRFESGNGDDIPGYFGPKDASNEWAITFTHRFGGM
ncbi:MAG: hypothetical protein ACXWVJ_08205, partial [Caulobacteraceae bacterium]